VLLASQQSPERLAYSIEEISKKTSLSKAFLRNEVKAGRLVVSRFGRRVLILQENLDAYLKKGSAKKEDGDETK
jgi:excisionase family DNA binding protein